MSESTYVITGEFGELRIEQDMIDVTSSLPQPDPRWTYTDEQGHQHRYDADFRPSRETINQPRGHEIIHYPTLVSVVDETYWCADCNDEHEETHLECRECGEHITPGTRGPFYRETIPGFRSYFLNDEPITEERFQEIAEQYGRRTL